MDSVTDLFDPTNPLAWLVGSVVLAVLATNAAWLLIGRRRNTSAPAVQQAGPAVAWLLQALYYLVPPVIAWRLGVLSPYYLGVTEPQWLEALSGGATLVAVTTGVLLFGWLIYRHTETVAEPPPADAARLLMTLTAPIDAFLQQWHWAFYRAVMIAWLTGGGLAGTVPELATQPLYWGTWLGLAFAALEFVLNPFARARLRRAGAREASLRMVALAMVTAALFTLTRNFWLCLACHVVVETVITGWLPLRTSPARP